MNLTKGTTRGGVAVALLGRCIVPFLSMAVLLLPSPVAADDNGLRTYGFFDIEAEVGDRDAAAKRWTFDQHHLTVIWLYDLDDHSRVLFETAYEHGPTIGESSYEGKIYLPKAYWEFMASDGAKIRVGKFLPPFGIYNERHDATPTLIPTVLPRSVYGKHLNLSGALSDSLGRKVRAYPRFAAGAWLLGDLFLGDWDVEYHAYLVNGRGAESIEEDDNTNKGIGGRLVISPPVGTLRIGISAYGDRNGELNNAKQQAFEADFECTPGDLFLEGAVLLSRFEELDSLGGLTGRFHERRGSYLMAGYTFFDRLMPFVYYDYTDHDPDRSDDGETDITVGVNHNLRQSVYLKGEVHFRSFQDDTIDPYRTFISSVSVAF